MRRIFSYLALLVLTAGPALAEDHGTFTAFRWNQGFRADRDPLLETEMSELEFQTMVKEARLPEDGNLYRGCYLVHYRSSDMSRSLASTGKPVAQTYRICVPSQDSTPAASLP